MTERRILFYALINMPCGVTLAQAAVGYSLLEHIAVKENELSAVIFLIDIELIEAYRAYFPDIVEHTEGAAV